MTTAPARTYLTSAEASDYSRLSVHTLRDAAAAGELASIQNKPRGRRLFTTTDIDAWLDGKRRAAIRPLRSTG